MSKHPLLTREGLYQAYIVEGRTPTDIAREAGIKPPGIYEYLRKYNIPIRARVRPTKDQLYRMYIEEKKTLEEISELIDLSTTQINYWLDKFEIVKRTVSDYATTVDAEWLTEQRLLRKTWLEIRTDLDMNSSKFFRMLKRMGIPTDDGKDRTIRTNHRGQEDKFTVLEKRSILSRDEHRCQMPGCRSYEDLRLEIHHIVSIRDGGETSLSNAVTLCRQHHREITGREKEYILLFQEIVKRNTQKAIDAISVKLPNCKPSERDNTEGTPE
jgi:transposase-like protein